MNRKLLRDRDMRLITVAVGLSAMGDWLAIAPLSLHLAEVADSGFALAALFGALWAPSVLLAGPAGRLVDRFEARALIICVSLVQAAAALALAFVEGSTAVIALAAVLGTGFALAQPAEFALVPEIARGQSISAANGLIETARYVGFTIGPAIGGLLAAVEGTTIALLANAATFLVVVAAATALRARRRPAVPATAAGEREGGGVRQLFRDRGMAIVMAVSFFSLLFMTAIWTAEVFFVVDDLGGGEIGYGLLMTSWTLGMAVGALGLAPRLGTGALVTFALLATAIQGLGLATPAIVLSMVVAVISFIAGGLAHGVKNVLVRTLIHVRVPRHLQGRSFAAYNGMRNGAELLALLGGAVLVSLAGPRLTVLIAGLGSMLVGLVGLALYRRRGVEGGRAQTGRREPQVAAASASG
ncbi:MAG: MFS transporter [Solirubrobacterales bacterium]